MWMRGKDLADLLGCCKKTAGSCRRIPDFFDITTICQPDQCFRKVLRHQKQSCSSPGIHLTEHLFKQRAEQMWHPFFPVTVVSCPVNEFT